MTFNFKSLGLAVLASTLISTSAFGAAVGTGSFGLSGTATGAADGIDFYLHTPGDQTGSINLPTTGVFANLAPTTVETVQNLTSGNGVTPGTSFDFQNWIQLSNGIDLDATSIPIPVFPVCPASGMEAIGFECLVNSHSPVVLTQNVTGVSARINVLGNAHWAGDMTLTPFTGLFNAPSTSFQTIAEFETYFDMHGTIPEVNYAANFSTTPTPEPTVLLLTSAGFLGFGLLARRKRTSR